jgi:hypothetical protein
MDIKTAKQFFKQCCTFERTHWVTQNNPLFKPGDKAGIFHDEIISLIHDMCDAEEDAFSLRKMEYLVFRYKGADIIHWVTIGERDVPPIYLLIGPLSYTWKIYPRSPNKYKNEKKYFLP